MSIISSPFIMFDGMKITSNTKILVRDHIILMYILNILDEDTYWSILKLANIYYKNLIFMVYF